MNELLPVFKALSDETRLRIVKLLERGELCVCDLVAALGMVQPKVSFHLAILRKAGLITDRKQGKWSYYKLDERDMFKRFLLLGIIEKAGGAATERDRKHLADFIALKKRNPEAAFKKTKAKGCAC